MAPLVYPILKKPVKTLLENNFMGFWSLYLKKNGPSLFIVRYTLRMLYSLIYFVSDSCSIIYNTEFYNLISGRTDVHLTTHLTEVAQLPQI